MSRSKLVHWSAWSLACAALLTCACGFFDSHNVSVLNNDLIIPTGGTGEVMFQGIAGQTLTVTLVAHKTSMVPFATMVGPNGGQVAAPPVSSATNGTNTGTVSLSESGTYRLVVQDNSGQGGTVTVRVER